MTRPADLPLAGAGFRTRVLGEADVAALQALIERCADFNDLVEGRPPGPDAARENLADRPPGSAPEDKALLGVENAAGDLVGVIDLVRGHPGAGDWYLGLLMLGPEARGAGLGGAVTEALAEAVRAAGGRRLLLGVVEANAGGLRFWRRHGFEEVRRLERRIGARDHVLLELVRRLG